MYEEYNNTLECIKKALASVGVTTYNNKRMYNQIAYCKKWYEGYVEQFHKTVVTNGMSSVAHNMYRLEMAGCVCRDWVSSLLGEDIEITVSDSNKQASVFLKGKKGNTGVLGSNDFDTQFAIILEKMFALGTAGIAIGVENLGVSSRGTIIVGDDTKLSLDYYDATQIYPISWKGSTITECAFVTDYYESGELMHTIRIDRIIDNKSVVFLYNADKDYAIKDRNNPDVITFPEVVNTFVIFKLPRVNRVDFNSPLGISVFADAIDTLKAIDTCYDNCVVEVESGRRLVVMDKSLLGTDDMGNPIVPQESHQSNMRYVGDSNMITDGGNKLPVADFCPTLRTQQLDDELQNQLNILSVKVGFGTRYYTFSISGGVTATEYVGSCQDYQRNARKYSSSISTSLEKLMSGILDIGNLLGMVKTNSPKIDVVVPDGVITDDSAERETDRQDVSMGVMSKIEYRAKWYGETEEEAAESLEKITEKADTSESDETKDDEEESKDSDGTNDDVEKTNADSGSNDKDVEDDDKVSDIGEYKNRKGNGDEDVDVGNNKDNKDSADSDKDNKDNAESDDKDNKDDADSDEDEDDKDSIKKKGKKSGSTSKGYKTNETK